MNRQKKGTLSTQDVIKSRRAIATKTKPQGKFQRRMHRTRGKKVGGNTTVSRKELRPLGKLWETVLQKRGIFEFRSEKEPGVSCKGKKAGSARRGRSKRPVHNAAKCRMYRHVGTSEPRAAVDAGKHKDRIKKEEEEAAGRRDKPPWVPGEMVLLEYRRGIRDEERTAPPAKDGE